MAKRKKQARVSATDEGFSHNPFAGLGGRPAQEQEPEPAPEQEPEPERPDRVILHIERKGRGGKTVTRVSGLGGLGKSARKKLARELGRALGVGASLDAEDILVQGDQRDRVQAFFDER